MYEVRAKTPSTVAIQEMSWQVSMYVFYGGQRGSPVQIHYNQGADILTYVEDPSVFEVKNGCIAVPVGTYSQKKRVSQEG